MATALLDPSETLDLPPAAALEDRLVQVVDGEILKREPMGLEAGFAAGECYAELRQYAKHHGGVAFTDGNCFRAFGPDGTRPRYPDASYVAAGRLETIPRSVGRLAPDLCVEVVSPNDLSTNVREKVEEYLAAGVREVWVVDPAVRVVEAYGPDRTTTYRPGQTLTSEDVLPGFEMAVDGLFPKAV